MEDFVLGGEDTGVDCLRAAVRGATSGKTLTGLPRRDRPACFFVIYGRRRPPRALSTRPPCWVDLEGPQIHHLYFYLFADGPKNTKCPRMGLGNGHRG